VAARALQRSSAMRWLSFLGGVAFGTAGIGLWLGKPRHRDGAPEEEAEHEFVRPVVLSLEPCIAPESRSAPAPLESERRDVDARSQRW
jgi:hypothetical protein